MPKRETRLPENTSRGSDRSTRSVNPTEESRYQEDPHDPRGYGKGRQSESSDDSDDSCENTRVRQAGGYRNWFQGKLADASTVKDTPAVGPQGYGNDAAPSRRPRGKNKYFSIEQQNGYIEDSIKNKMEELLSNSDGNLTRKKILFLIDNIKTSNQSPQDCISYLESLEKQGVNIERKARDTFNQRKKVIIKVIIEEFKLQP